MRLARTTPYYKRNAPHICSFWVKGECKRGEVSLLCLLFSSLLVYFFPPSPPPGVPVPPRAAQRPRRPARRPEPARPLLRRRRPGRRQDHEARGHAALARPARGPARHHALRRRTRRDHHGGGQLSFCRQIVSC